MEHSIKRQTEYFIRDLHARESMRLGWYRQWQNDGRIKELRERKAQHQAFLNDLLRRRELKPLWYSRFYYLMGHGFGLFTAFLPLKTAQKIERTLEFWILMRYEKYLKELKLEFNLRSMIEAMQMNKLNHNEPGDDVLQLFQNFIDNQRYLLKS